MNKYYLTTPIYYVNAKPHIGHIYTTIAADVMARWRRSQGDDVVFSTGVDENSQKNVEAAVAAGKDVTSYVDEMAELWEKTFKQLGFTYTTFIRTTSPAHATAVKALITAIDKKGDIYLGDYEGLYCVGCEAFIAEKDLIDGTCPIHRTEPKKIKEKNYFFKLSKYRDQLLQHYQKHLDWLQPESAKNKMLYYIEHELEDISISRQAQEWGIRLPQDPSHAVYVWFDALINYLTVVGYPDDNQQFTKFWPADLHLIGKDIIKFHCAIWPAMLLSAGLALPGQVFAHGFFTIDGQKISKSVGNAIDPLQLMQDYPVDFIRYFLLRDIPFGNDGDFSHERLHDRYNADFANGLGNLVSRTLNMIEQFAPDFEPKETINPLIHIQNDRHLATLHFERALEEIWITIATADQYIETHKPWQLVKAGQTQEALQILQELYATLVHINANLAPFMPATYEKLTQILAARPLKKPAEPLFARKA